ncbi:transcriptional regulator [Cystobacter fuscus]
MAEKWDKQLMDFLKRTGEELKRTGDDLKTEAQRLLVEVQDPNNQAKVKEGLQNLRVWAMATGKQAAEHLESAVRRVEETVEGAFDKHSSSATPASGAPRVAHSVDASPASGDPLASGASRGQGGGQGGRVQVDRTQEALGQDRSRQDRREEAGGQEGELSQVDRPQEARSSGLLRPASGRRSGPRGSGRGRWINPRPMP